MVIAPPIPDTEVVLRAQSGDRAAFQQLYETYLPKVYDFVLGMLRNRADAEDATSETFLKAVERLGDLREPAAFKGWLYTIARNAALRIIDGRGRATPVAEHFESATTVEPPAIPDPAARAEETELRNLFDDAASTLSERERTVYDLTVRHGLGSAEVARVLGVRPAYAYILVNRLKPSVSEALEAVLLAKSGRDACVELATLLDTYHGEVSPRMRKAVARHAKTCAACADTKRSRASVPALLQGMAFAQPGTAFASELAAKIDAHWADFGPHGSSAGGAAGGGLATVVGAALTVVVLTGAAMGFGAQRTITPREELTVSLAPVSEVQPAQPVAPAAPQPATDSSPRRSTARAPRPDPGLGGVVTGNDRGTMPDVGNSSSTSETTSETTTSFEDPSEESSDNPPSEGSSDYPPPQEYCCQNEGPQEAP